MDSSTIPEQYRKDWSPYETEKMLIHCTKQENWDEIQKVGFIEPRDPSPQHWAGMKAVYFFNEDDALSPDTLEKMRLHEEKTHEGLVRLYIKTENKLYKSNDPGRSFHIMTLDPVPLAEIIKSEKV